MAQPDVVTAQVQNIEIDGDFVIDSFPSGSLIGSLSITRNEDYEQAVEDLHDRYVVSLTIDRDTGAFVAERDVPRLHRFRQWPVTTASAEIRVAQVEPGSTEWWRTLDGELFAVRRLLSFIYRRSINFVDMQTDGQTETGHGREPRLLAANYSSPLMEGDRFRRDFVTRTLPRYYGLMASEAPLERAFHDAMLYYLGSFRDGLLITERFMCLFTSLEILANGYAKETGRADLLPDGAFEDLKSCLFACVDDLPDEIESSVRDSMRGKLKHENRSSIGRKVRQLAGEHGLRAYRHDIRPWIKARDELVHSGTTKALASREDFWEGWVAKLRGFLERMLISILLPGRPGRLYWFSDSWEKGRDGAPWRAADVWPEE
jgi:hypothetical protein